MSSKGQGGRGRRGKPRFAQHTVGASVSSNCQAEATVTAALRLRHGAPRRLRDLCVQTP